MPKRKRNTPGRGSGGTNLTPGAIERMLANDKARTRGNKGQGKGKGKGKGKTKKKDKGALLIEELGHIFRIERLPAALDGLAGKEFVVGHGRRRYRATIQNWEIQGTNVFLVCNGPRGLFEVKLRIGGNNERLYCEAENIDSTDLHRTLGSIS